MKYILILLTTLICFTTANGKSKKESNFSLDIDTISQTNDSIFVKILHYLNDTLIEETTGFIFPDSLRVPRFRLTGNLIKHTIYAIRVELHGKSIEYSSDNKKKIVNYENNVAKSTLYYDKYDNEISQQEYTGFFINTICYTKMNTYIIIGKNAQKIH